MANALLYMTGPRDLGLLVWDMQRGIAPNSFNYGEILPNVTALIGAARGSNIPIVYSQHTGIEYRYMSEYAKESLRRRGLDPRSASYMSEGSAEWAFVDGISPQQGEVVIKKYTPSLFVGTYAEHILRNSGVTRLVLCGVATEAGIVGTAWHAAALGFIPIIVEDAVGGRTPETHEAALKVMKLLFTVLSTAEAVKIMRQQSA